MREKGFLKGAIILTIFGIVGIIMITKLLLSIRSLLKPRFYPGDNEIHSARKQAKNKCSSHNKV